MKIQFDKANLIQNPDGYWLSIRVKPLEKAKQFVDSFRSDKIYDADLKIHREKRSLDANSYFWVLCGKLSAKINVSMEAIYRQYIKDIGDNFEIIPIRDDAKETWIKNWKSRGLGWICEDVGSSDVPGYSNLICYYGSSTYDSAQMSRLIDFAIQDCKDQGIDTETPDEIAKMEALWEEKKSTA